MSKTIFIVDTDPDTIEIVSYILVEAGYIVALPISLNLLSDINSIKPDLILIDDWAELISVGELVRALKATNLLNSIPVLIFSTANDLAALAKSCCADGYISKPFDIEEMEGTIRSAINY